MGQRFVRRGRLLGVLAFAVVAVAIACQKASLPAAVPNGITVSLSSPIITADGGTVEAAVRVFQDGVALLGQPVTIQGSGAVVLGPISGVTSTTSGIAAVTLSGLTIAGFETVTAHAGNVSGSAVLSILHGAPANLSVSIPMSSQNITADQGSISYTLNLADAKGNPIPPAGVLVSTNAPIAAGGSIGSGTITGLRTASPNGTPWQLNASLPTTVTPVTANAVPFTVTHGTAAADQTTLSQTSIGQQQTLIIGCAEMDGYGNNTGNAFATANVSIVDGGGNAVTATIAANGMVTNSFTATAFGKTGALFAKCAKGALSSTASFDSIAQTATNSVVATLAAPVVEAGNTVGLVCKEVDGFGNDVNHAFTGAGAVTISPSGPNITDSGDHRNFTVGPMNAKGGFTVTCADGGLTNTASFTSNDTTPPTLSSVGETAATGPNGVTSDHAYAAGTIVTVSFTASDVVGVASTTVAILDTAQLATIFGGRSYTFYESTPGSPVTHSFPVVIRNGAPTFGKVTVGITSADTTGNTSTPATLAITVDPALSIPEPTGVTLRTRFEGDADASPVALASSAHTLFVKRFATVGGDIVRITGSGASASSSVFAANLVPGLASDFASGMVFVPGGFAGESLFHTLIAETGVIAAVSGGVSSTFSTGPTHPSDVSYGTVGGVTSLVYLELGSALTESIDRVDAAGSVTGLTTLSVTSGGIVNGSLVVSTGGSILVAGTSGSVASVGGAGALTPITNLGPNDAEDIAVGLNGALLVAGGRSGSLYRIHGGTPQTPVPLLAPIGVVVDPTVAGYPAYVLDRGSAGATPWRIYQVTGY